MASDTESDEEVVFPSDSEEETEADGIGAVADECSNVAPTSSPSMTRQVSYTMVMGTEEVLRMRAMMINDVIEVGLNEEAATDLLVKCKWNLADTMEGLLNATSSSDAPSSLPLPLTTTEASGTSQQVSVEGSQHSTPLVVRCLVCDEPPPAVDLGCGHALCSECWSTYLSTALLNRGEAVVSTPCFYTDGKRPCPRRVPVSLFQQHLPPEHFTLFQKRLASDFIAGHSTLSSCPAPNCDLVVRYEKLSTRDVTCNCGQNFCFNCSENAHHPIGCAKASKWRQKEVGEGSTASYLTLHTKPCPKCHTPIAVHVCDAKCSNACQQKNRPAMGGCNHFTCSCRHQFCWLCMRDWKTHATATTPAASTIATCLRATTSSSYSRMPQQSSKAQGDLKPEEAAREELRKEARRYEFYYARYQQHQTGVKSHSALLHLARGAADILGQAIDASITNNSQTAGGVSSPTVLEHAGLGGGFNQVMVCFSEYYIREVKFLVEAADLLGDARRVLMWTYAYAFFLPSEHANRRLLEQQQGDLEKYTNHVHSEVVRFCEINASVEAAAVASGHAALLHGSWQFKANFTTYTAAIRKFVAGLEAQVRAWEKQEEVYGADELPTGKIGVGAEAGLMNRASKAEEEDRGGEILPREDWQCRQCTYLNTHTTHANSCVMCSAPRLLLGNTTGLSE